MLPATRKKGNARRFLVESGFKDGLAGSTRSKQSWDTLCRDWKGATAKTGEKKRKERRRCELNRAARKQGEAMQQPSHASAKPEVATGATGSRRKVADGEVSPEDTVHRNYRIATRLFSQITPKFVW